MVWYPPSGAVHDHQTLGPPGDGSPASRVARKVVPMTFVNISGKGVRLAKSSFAGGCGGVAMIVKWVGWETVTKPE